MFRRIPLRLAVFGIVLLILASALSAFAGSNSVPGSRAGRMTQAIDANSLKPAACAGLNLTAIFVCPATGGNCNATGAPELILGSPYADTINGRGGDDCILGGDGDDDLTGGPGNNVCIGGLGTDTFKQCQTAIQ